MMDAVEREAKLDRLRETAQAASTAPGFGEWFVESCDDDEAIIQDRTGVYIMAEANSMEYGEFIAAADPAAVLDLLATIDEFRAEREAVIAAVNLYGDDVLHRALDDIGFAPREAV